MKMERVALVTGASGFIGRRLCQALKAQGWRVVGVCRKDASGPWDRLIKHEFGSGAFEVDEEPEWVFHLAARTHALAETPKEKAAYLRTNVEGMKELLAAVGGRPGVRVVFASSVKAFGEATPCSGVDEDVIAYPNTPYGESKLAAEKLLLDSILGPRSTILRLAMVYGVGQKGNLAEMIRAVSRNRFPPIPENGNRRSMVHVDDVVEALLAAATAPVTVCGGRVYYIAGARSWSSRELYVEMCRALGRPVRDWAIPLPVLRVAGGIGDAVGFVRGRRFVWDSDKYNKLFGSACFLSERAMRELGYRPRRSPETEMVKMAREELLER